MIPIFPHEFMIHNNNNINKLPLTLAVGAIGSNISTHLTQNWVEFAPKHERDHKIARYKRNNTNIQFLSQMKMDLSSKSVTVPFVKQMFPGIRISETRGPFGTRGTRVPEVPGSRTVLFVP
jgi:hypothetical protein